MRFLFSRIALKDICDAKSLRLGHDLHISVNERVITAFRKENRTLAKISKFIVFSVITQSPL